MRRTIKLTEATVLVKTTEGIVEMKLLLDGKATEQKIIKKAKEVVVKDGKVIGVVDTKEVEKVYVCSLEDFISISEEVTEVA